MKYIFTLLKTVEHIKNVRYVSTWSPLATAFNSKQIPKVTFNIIQDPTGLFGIPQLRDPDGFYLLQQNAVLKSDELIRESCSANRKRKMVDIFDDLSDTLCQVADLAEFVRVAHPQFQFAHAAEESCISLNALVEKLNTNTQLYNALKTVVENGDSLPTDNIDAHVAKLFLFDFEQSGIHLDKEKRKQVVHLNECILHLGTSFMKNCVLPRAISKDQLPADVKKLFQVEGDKVVVTGLYADSPKENLREAGYKLYLYPDSHQEELLSMLLKARYELGVLCGFPSFAHRALRGSLAEKPHVVRSFLDHLADQIRGPAEENLDLISAKKKSWPSSSYDLKPWDIPYYTALIKNEKFNMHQSEFAPYFSLGSCMEGLNLLFHNLYGITLCIEEMQPGESWHSDIHKLAVKHHTEGILGYIYCDFFERPGKPNQDCHFTIRGGRLRQDGTYQLPIVVLLLNFPQPKRDTPSLLTPGMMENLFHEMGHAMHSMLARTKHQHVTGTRCSTDFAEVPSVLMEYFATDPRVLSTFARHYATGKLLPFDMLSQLCQSKHLFSASEMQLQLFYSALDQTYHLGPTGNKSTTEILAEVQKKYYSVEYVPNTAWQLRFSHLIGYAAKYYSYLMSRAVASMIWQQSFQNDPFSRTMGERYRTEILAHGGGKPAKELVEGFIGETVTPKMLADSLAEEIKNNNPKN